MVAIIKEHLVSPARSGTKVIVREMSGCCISHCTERAQNYILGRIFDKSRIEVEYFDVKIKNANRKNCKVLDSWTYIPTYRAKKHSENI